jgi:hypothetical protein
MKRINPEFISFLRKNWLIVVILVLAICAAGWFAIQMIMDFIYFHDPRNQDIILKEWMTPRYVVHSYDLPRATVAEILGLTQDGDRGRRLIDIANDMGLTMDELTQIVRDGAAQYRAHGQ